MVIKLTDVPPVNFSWLPVTKKATPPESAIALRLGQARGRNFIGGVQLLSVGEAQSSVSAL